MTNQDLLSWLFESHQGARQTQRTAYQPPTREPQLPERLVRDPSTPSFVSRFLTQIDPRKQGQSLAVASWVGSSVLKGLVRGQTPSGGLTPYYKLAFPGPIHAPPLEPNASIRHRDSGTPWQPTAKLSPSASSSPAQRVDATRHSRPSPPGRDDRKPWIRRKHSGGFPSAISTSLTSPQP